MKHKRKPSTNSLKSEVSYNIYIADIVLHIGQTKPQGPAMPLSRFFVNKNFISNLLSIAEHSHYHVFYIIADKPVYELNHLKRYVNVVTAAGGIVWDKSDRLLMIYRQGKWDLPKGKVEANERKRTGAAREVKEETGVEFLKVLKQKGISTYHLYPLNNEWVLKETHWYDMVAEDNQTLIAQQSEDISAVQWVPRKNISLLLEDSYPSVRDLVNTKLEESKAAQSL